MRRWSTCIIPTNRARVIGRLRRRRRPYRNQQQEENMSYDPTSRFARRELFTLLGAGALLTRRAAAAESSLRFAALDHVGITVADAQKSTAFYARLFGNTV